MVQLSFLELELLHPKKPVVCKVVPVLPGRLLRQVPRQGRRQGSHQCQPGYLRRPPLPHAVLQAGPEVLGQGQPQRLRQPRQGWQKKYFNSLLTKGNFQGK